MKFNLLNDKTIVFLNKLFIADLEINNEEKLEKYLKKIFIKLKDIYGMNIYGFYDLDIYQDFTYGIVIEIVKDDLYSDYFNQVDMRITVNNTTFLYRIDDIDYEGKIYKYNDKIYLEPYNKDYYNIGKLLEFSELIYKNTDRIRNSKEVKYEKTSCSTTRKT